MARALRYFDRVTHRPPNAADAPGLAAAFRALYSDEPMTPEEVAAHEHAARTAAHRTRQGDLLLPLPAHEAQ